MLAPTLHKENKIKGKTPSPTIQAKLTIGASNDKYEREADSMANQIMQMPQSFSNQPLNKGAKDIQRKCTNCENEEEHIQRKPLMMKSEGGTPVATQALGSQLNSTKGSGSPLPSDTNSFMGNAFGTDFSNVRVHTGGSAIQMNQGLNARAFTHGSDIYFNKGQYSPGSSEGKRLLAHELTHTIQQNNSSLLQRSCGSSAIGTVSGCAGVGGQDIFDVGENSNDIYLFNKDCDEFRTSEGTRLAIYAATISPDATVEIHGFSSEEGDTDFNDNLSCARAKIAAVIVSTSTRATIDLYHHGATPGLREDRRSIVIRVIEPQVEEEVPAPTTPTYVACNDGSSVHVNKGGSYDSCTIVSAGAGTATPDGVYCIREQGAAQLGRSFGHPFRDHSDWYLLEPQFPTTRFRMHLHPGSITAGCTTVTSSSCYSRISRILNSSGRIRRDGYDGYPPGNSEGVVNPKTSKTCVGLLIVRSGGSCSFMTGSAP